MTQTIEQLTARVRELEADLAAARQIIDEENKDHIEQLAASQLREKQLREALQTYIDEHEECQDADDWMAMMCSIEAHHVAREALATPISTEALDAYVERNVKEARRTAEYWKSNHLAGNEQIATLTRHRDLAVEAVPTFVAEFARFVGGDGEFWLHELEDFLDTWKKMQDYTIKEGSYEQE